MKRKMHGARSGVLSGGNWIVDEVKIVDVFPRRECLANIRRQFQGTGGAPYNVLLDLARLGAKFPLIGAGLVGDDELGRGVFRDCKAHGVSMRYVGVTPKAPTSYTDVMTEGASGCRTFFHARGANALWRGEDLDFEHCRARIFHLGYLLLLDALDEDDSTYGTKAARMLAAAQRAGMKTSVDVVSEDSGRFAKIVTPALRHADYCILNEIEAGRTTGVEIRRSDGGLDASALQKAAEGLLERGVRELVIIHFPEGGYARTRAGAEVWQPSLKLPDGFIAGGAGAGDAFCAGCLLGLHEGWDLPRSLLAAVCAAAACLSHPTCTAGVGSLRSALALAKKFGLRKLPDVAG
jgi:sugar/nucleoside kinase (ribokinase family)